MYEIGHVRYLILNRQIRLSTKIDLLFVFSFCFFDLVINSPRPKDMAPPVWLFMSGWIAYDASTQVTKFLMSSAARTYDKFLVPCRYSSTRLSLIRSYSVHVLTRVVKKAMAV